MADRPVRVARALQKVAANKASRVKVEEHLETARATFRRSMLVAVDAGANHSELARILGTSTSRIRQDLVRARAEAGR